MFPEIFRDEVFRLETRRLWLRWPVRGDVVDVGADPQRDHPGMHEPKELDAAILASWRAAMTEGRALHLALVTKSDHHSIGLLHLVPNQVGALELDGRLNAGHHGRGYLAEAVQAAAHAVFRLARPAAIEAAPAVDDAEGRSALQHCGLTYAGSGMRRSRTGRGLEACDHYRLDEATWASLQGWGWPGFGAYVSRGSVSPSCGVAALTM
jgi:RimJ/RimL family protein N-acetyltransferase